MDVDHPAWKGRQERRGDQPHEPGQHHHLNLGRAQALYHCKIECSAIGKGSRFHHRGAQVVILSVRQGSRLRTIGDHDRDLRGHGPTFDRLQYRREIRSPPGGQYAETQGKIRKSQRSQPFLSFPQDGKKRSHPLSTRAAKRTRPGWPAVGNVTVHIFQTGCFCASHFDSPRISLHSSPP